MDKQDKPEVGKRFKQSFPIRLHRIFVIILSVVAGILSFVVMALLSRNFHILIPIFHSIYLQILTIVNQRFFKKWHELFKRQSKITEIEIQSLYDHII